MGKLRGKLLFLRGKFPEYINAHDIWLSRCPLRGGAHRHVCPAYAQYSAQYTQVARVSLRGGSSERRTMSNTTPQMEALAEAFAQALMPVVAMLAQPAQTVTQAVTTVAKTGQRRISQAVKNKVKQMRVRNGGPVPNGVPCWQLIDDGIIDADGNYIAEVKAPSAGTTVTAAKQASSGLTAGDIKRMNRAELAQHISRKDLIALL